MLVLVAFVSKKRPLETSHYLTSAWRHMASIAWPQYPFTHNNKSGRILPNLRSDSLVYGWRPQSATNNFVRELDVSKIWQLCEVAKVIARKCCRDTLAKADKETMLNNLNLYQRNIRPSITWDGFGGLLAIKQSPIYQHHGIMSDFMENELERSGGIPSLHNTLEMPRNMYLHLTEIVIDIGIAP